MESESLFANITVRTSYHSDGENLIDPSEVVCCIRPFYRMYRAVKK